MKNKTHDYTERSWGKNYNILSIKNDGHNISLCGWGIGLNRGDYILIKNEDYTTRYVMSEVLYQSDPKDMWFGEAEFAPREL